jgi:hypothetical protein
MNGSNDSFHALKSAQSVKPENGIKRLTMAKNEQQELMFKMMQLMETEIKGLHEKVDYLLNTPLTQHVPSQMPGDIPLVPPISTVQQNIDDESEIPIRIPPMATPKLDDGLASWERPKPKLTIEDKTKKKGINFTRLLIFMGAIILVVIFFTYGIPWINYFSAPR